MDIRVLDPDQFPPQLSEIADPPEKLYIMGEWPKENFKYLTVVGSRKFSDYGKKVVEKLISGLKGYPVVIISGLALGIDSLAHKEALRAGLKTVAVPGSGIHPSVLYPRTNLKLAKEILEKGGSILSELEPKTKAAPYTFPKRNRIMAGLSDAVLLIEAQERSGTLITARLATEYDRDLLVVPNSIFSPNSKGAHQFLKMGALPITSSEDILEALGIENKSEKIKPNDLTTEEQKIYELLMIEPVSKDELLKKLSMDITKANITITTMELKGLIKESVGKIHLT